VRVVVGDLRWTEPLTLTFAILWIVVHSAMLGNLGMFASESIHGEALWEVHKLFGR
jgi:hypothetical protein